MKLPRTLLRLEVKYALKYGRLGVCRQSSKRQRFFLTCTVHVFRISYIS